MADDKKNLEIELVKLDISGRVSAKNSGHVVTAELLWPRMLVASRSTVRTLKLVKGVRDLSSSPWVDRILFKESVEFRFGLMIKVSQSISTTKFDEFIRFIGGAVFGGAASFVENEIAGPLGDMTTSPLDFARKKALASFEAETILEGGWDFHTAELPDEQLVDIPLLSLADRYTPIPLPIEKGSHSTRTLIDRAGTRLGTATLAVRVLKK